MTDARITLRVRDGCELEVSAPTPKELLQRLCDFSELVADSACGRCGCTETYYEHRRPKGNDYFSLRCSGCGAQLDYHLNKDADTVYVTRHEHDRGWYKWTADGVAQPQDDPAPPPATQPPANVVKHREAVRRARKMESLTSVGDGVGWVLNTKPFSEDENRVLLSELLDAGVRCATDADDLHQIESWIEEAMTCAMLKKKDVDALSIKLQAKWETLAPTVS